MWGEGGALGTSSGGGWGRSSLPCRDCQSQCRRRGLRTPTYTWPGVSLLDPSHAELIHLHDAARGVHSCRHRNLLRGRVVAVRRNAPAPFVPSYTVRTVSRRRPKGTGNLGRTESLRGSFRSRRDRAADLARELRPVIARRLPVTGGSTVHRRVARDESAASMPRTI